MLFSYLKLWMMLCFLSSCCFKSASYVNEALGHRLHLYFLSLCMHWMCMCSAAFVATIFSHSVHL